jgi:hypothetical protein
MTLHWSIPAMILPPIAFGLTLSSALASFIVISLFLQPSSGPASKARLPPRLGAAGQILGQDGKKFENDLAGRRTVSFVDSGSQNQLEGGRGGLVLKATGVDAGNSYTQPVVSNQTGESSLAVNGMSLPSTPVKRNPGQSGHATMQKSPAPSVMIQRKASASRQEISDDELMNGGEEPGFGEPIFSDSMTETETETEDGTDRGL